MLLVGRIIDGDTVGVDIEPTQHMDICVVSSVPADHADISSIENWEKYWRWCRQQADYIQVCEEVNQLMITAGGYGSLTAAEKVIASKFNLTTAADREADLGGHDGAVAALCYWQEMTGMARYGRLTHAWAQVSHVLTPADYTDMVADGVYYDLYIRYRNIGDMTITTWLDGASPYDTANTGLRTRSYTPHGMTLDNLCDNMIAIFTPTPND